MRHLGHSVRHTNRHETVQPRHAGSTKGGCAPAGARWPPQRNDVGTAASERRKAGRRAPRQHGDRSCRCRSPRATLARLPGVRMAAGSSGILTIAALGGRDDDGPSLGRVHVCHRCPADRQIARTEKPRGPIESSRSASSAHRAIPIRIATLRIAATRRARHSRRAMRACGDAAGATSGTGSTSAPAPPRRRRRQSAGQRMRRSPDRSRAHRAPRQSDRPRAEESPRGSPSV